ncbi:hypothetical protein E2C01_002133 [Portunus trituberculatus]|uniref:Uncharacterized protein n=1 Tax=Portunus trituberculatus TaxID=210409 RepID=A0A5B7CJK4_PORTR|nr:hypothetical protein [Portunus trituberculatus]
MEMNPTMYVCIMPERTSACASVYTLLQSLALEAASDGEAILTGLEMLYYHTVTFTSFFNTFSILCWCREGHGVPLHPSVSSVMTQNKRQQICWSKEAVNTTQPSPGHHSWRLPFCTTKSTSAPVPQCVRSTSSASYISRELGSKQMLKSLGIGKTKGHILKHFFTASPLLLGLVEVAHVLDGVLYKFNDRLTILHY